MLIRPFVKMVNLYYVVSTISQDIFQMLAMLLTWFANIPIH